MRVEGIYLVLLFRDVPDTALPDGTSYISLPVTLKSCKMLTCRFDVDEFVFAAL
jgi:hypothetical protein